MTGIDPLHEVFQELRDQPGDPLLCARVGQRLERGHASRRKTRRRRNQSVTMLTLLLLSACVVGAKKTWPTFKGWITPADGSGKPMAVELVRIDPPSDETK